MRFIVIVVVCTDATSRRDAPGLPMIGPPLHIRNLTFYVHFAFVESLNPYKQTHGASKKAERFLARTSATRIEYFEYLKFFQCHERSWSEFVSLHRSDFLDEVDFFTKGFASQFIPIPLGRLSAHPDDLQR